MSFCICFHGTTGENAHVILREGFKPGTYIAMHLEHALAFGGDHVFFVRFENDGFSGPVDWRFHTRIRIEPSMILKLVRYSPDEVYCNLEVGRLIERIGR